MGDDLYREICRCPEDDTLRLAYADWLDEHGDPDRAEFVRVQCALDAHPYCVNARTGDYDARDGVSPEWQKTLDLADREQALIAAHPEWSRFPCEKCDRWGCVMVDTGVDIPARGKAKGGRLYRPGQCDACHGTGDLFRAPGVSGASLTPPPKPRDVTFARGFLDSVACTLAEAFAPDGVPTAWACEVVRRTPVTRFVLTDRTPYWNGAGYCWYRTGRHRPSQLVPEPAVLSEVLMVLVNVKNLIVDRWVPFESPAAAVDALALAAGRLVRRHVYGEAAA